MRLKAHKSVSSKVRSLDADWVVMTEYSLVAMLVNLLVLQMELSKVRRLDSDWDVTTGYSLASMLVNLLALLTVYLWVFLMDIRLRMKEIPLV